MPRTLAENATYIAETIKPAIKSAIEAQGVTVPSTDSFLDYADRIAEIEGGGSGYQLKDLPTGAISTVNDAAPLPLNALKVSVEAWQEGSGDPSPSNVRPIHGWSSGEITVVGKNKAHDVVYTNVKSQYVPLISAKYHLVSGKAYVISFMTENTGIEIYRDSPNNIGFATLSPYSVICDGTRKSIYGVANRTGDVHASVINRLSGTSDVGTGLCSEFMIEEVESGTTTPTAYEPYQGKQYTLDFPQTIYGAEWDVVNGEMNNQYNIVDMGDLVWGFFGVYNNHNLFYTESLVGQIAHADNTKIHGSFEIFKMIPDVDINIMENHEGRVRAVDGRLYVNYDETTSGNDFRTIVTGHKLRYELATPTTIDLSPLSIRMLQGTNNVYADYGEVIEGEYFVDEGAIDVRKVDYQIGSSGSIKTIDGRVLSGFTSMNGYHARPLDASGNWLDVDWSKDWEIGTAFKLTALTQTLYVVGSGNSGDYYRSPVIAFNKDSTHLLAVVSYSTSSQEVMQTNFSPSVNTWYAVKLSHDATNHTLTMAVSSDFDTWSTIGTVSLSNLPYHNGASLALGNCAQEPSYATDNLLIDTFNTYIKGDGVNWGAFTGVFPR